VESVGQGCCSRSSLPGLRPVTRQAVAKTEMCATERIARMVAKGTVRTSVESRSGLLGAEDRRRLAGLAGFVMGNLGMVTDTEPPMGERRGTK